MEDIEDTKTQEDEYEILHNEEERDPFRMAKQRLSLSVYNEAFEIGKRTCPGACAEFDPHSFPPLRKYPPSDVDSNSISNSISNSNSNSNIDSNSNSSNSNSSNSTTTSSNNNSGGSSARRDWVAESGLVSNTGFVSIAVRLVDVCANMMAGEYTCMHSDHSLGRCLIYGAHATPLGMTCQRELVNCSRSNRTETVTIPDSNRSATATATAAVAVDVVEYKSSDEDPYFPLPWVVDSSREISFLDLRQVGRLTSVILF